MAVSLKKFYESKTPREKVLLIAIIWVPILFWFNALMEGQREISANYEMALAKVEKSRLMISKSAEIEDGLKAAMQNFDETRLVKDLRVELEKTNGKIAQMESMTIPMCAAMRKPLSCFFINVLILLPPKTTHCCGLPCE